MSGVFSGFVTLCAYLAGLFALGAIFGLITEFRKAGRLVDSCGAPQDWTYAAMMAVVAVVMLTFFVSEVTKP
jgi:sugar phosphate permease